ncbi:hypothetical protein [Amycolatopsis sp.]|jgi:hypothetical protein|uniref:hypothetical protein n=1 Tax=Amycolatopsis sp. TaxID=37632 RepID=UPI002DFD190E|nr:hypothetical protein [Amycolatopsis sp.]
MSRRTARRVTWTVGNGGRNASSAANTATVTEPSGTAEKITAVARPASSGLTSGAASPAPIDQNAPITNPTRVRDIIMIG